MALCDLLWHLCRRADGLAGHGHVGLPRAAYAASYTAARSRSVDYWGCSL